MWHNTGSLDVSVGTVAGVGATQPTNLSSNGGID